MFVVPGFSEKEPIPNLAMGLFSEKKVYSKLAQGLFFVCILFCQLSIYFIFFIFLFLFIHHIATQFNNISRTDGQSYYIYL